VVLLSHNRAEAVALAALVEVRAPLLEQPVQAAQALAPVAQAQLIREQVLQGPAAR
jgi:hypothetical protein